MAKLDRTKKSKDRSTPVKSKLKIFPEKFL